MNNYLKVLLYLKQFEGDGKFHEIESVLENIDRKEKKEIFVELGREDLLFLDGGRTVGLPIILGYSNGTSKKIGGDNIRYEPFRGKITIKGLRYLKEHFEMTDKSKYNITVDGKSTANVIIGSPGATINSKTEIIDKVKHIVEKIENDETLTHSEKQEAIVAFTQLETEIKEGQPQSITIDKVLTLGAKISSIGSIVVALTRLLTGH